MKAALLSASLLAALAMPAPAAQEPLVGAAAAKAYEEVSVEGGGSVKGRVTFKGDPPQLKLAVSQDLAHCSHDGQNERPSPRLIVGKDGGVAEAVVYLREIPRGKPLAELKAEGLLGQKDCTYTPLVQIVPFKQYLKISNGDPINHNVHGRIGDLEIFNNAMPNAGWPKQDEIQKRMIRAGMVDVQCDVHPWMRAYVLVVKNPYYAVTGEDGAFALEGIPPGDYELALWHPGWQFEPVKDATGHVLAYKYGAPVEKSSKIKIDPGAERRADFILNE